MAEAGKRKGPIDHVGKVKMKTINPHLIQPFNLFHIWEADLEGGRQRVLSTRLWFPAKVLGLAARRGEER